MMEPILKVTEQLIIERYNSCKVAILGGSIVRGEGTSHSDLDLFIILPNLSSAYRESFTYHGYPVEAFIHNDQSYRDYFETDCLRARPSLPQMVSEGIVIRDHLNAQIIKEEAKALLERGPLSWDDKEIMLKRYELTDLLDDFEGSGQRVESIFIAGQLAECAHEFYLRTRNQWVGKGKWILRALKRYNPGVAEEFSRAFNHFFKEDEKEQVIEWVDNLLIPYGGRLFEGFSMGKPEQKGDEG